MRWYFVIFLLNTVLFSCDEQFGTDSDDVPKNVIDASTQLFPGSILEKSSFVIEDTDVWKVRLENSEGSIVSFYWQKNYNILFRIEGERGPFDYEFKPPLDVIIFSTAKFLAFESYSTEVLDSWKLIRDSSNDQKWVYQFYLQGEENPISINASNGDKL